MATGVGFGLGTVVAGLVAYFTRGTVYVVSDKYLTIMSGGLEIIIDLTWIQTVDLSRNAWPGPCRSINRVRITYQHGTTMVSPRQRERFITELNERRRNRVKTVSDLLR